MTFSPTEPRPHRAAHISVGLGDLGVAKDRGVVSTSGLGSCIAFCVYAPEQRVAGLLHFMLSESSLNRARAAADPLLFADTGIPILLREMERIGARISGAQVRLVGGASPSGNRSMAQIGQRNAVVARQLAWRSKLRLVAADVGGQGSRSVFFDVATGTVNVRTPGSPDRTL